MKFPIAIFVMGRPGAGKDTQADLLAKKLDLIRFSTNKLIRSVIYDSKNQEDETIKKEKAIYESGKLNTSSWVLKIFKEHVVQLRKKNFNRKKGVAFSGLLRTLEEAKGLTPFLKQVFGEKHMLVIDLELSEQEAMVRIKKRNAQSSRALDTGDKKLELRIQEFSKKTVPALNYLESEILLIKVDGSRSILEIETEIDNLINSNLK